MENNKLTCPVERLEQKPTMDVKLYVDDNSTDIKIDINTKYVIKSVVDFINKKINN